MKIVVIHEDYKDFLNNIILYKNYDAKLIDKDGYWVVENINEKILLDVLAIINIKLDIIQDPSRYTRLMWDPTHPDAIRTGEKEGFVEYPNVDIARETADQTAYTQLKNVIIAYLKEKYNVYIM